MSVLSDKGQLISRQLGDWGYYLLPKLHPTSLGYQELLIVTRPVPTQRHFDPERIKLQLCDGDNSAHEAVLHLNSSSRVRDRVCPGRIVLQDRVDKRVTFFTFGGSLELFSESEVSICLLHSPAPILELTPVSPTVTNQFVSEIELMLAVFRARWRTDQQGFIRRLCQQDPLSFYQASLASILLRTRRAPALKKCCPQFYHLICAERDWLKEIGQWRDPPITLGMLLGQ